MNAATQIRPLDDAPPAPAPTPAESPAALARANHEARRAALDTEEQAIRAKIARAEGVKAPVAKLSERRVALQDKLSESVAADIIGEAAPHDTESLHQQLGEVELELASLEVQAQGADKAIARLQVLLAGIAERRAAEMARRQGVQRAQHAEHLTGLAISGEHAVAQFLQWYVEAVAAAIVHDHIKAPAEPFTAAKLRTKFSVPVPFGLPVFDSLGAERDLGVAIQHQAEELLRELGAEARL